MDIPTLAQSVVAVIAPFLPDLLAKVTDKAAETVGGEIGKGATREAEKLWERIAHSDPDKEVTAAAEKVASSPRDDDAVAALRLHVRELLQRDAKLAADIRSLVVPKGQGNTASASGERSIAVGGSADGATIVSGKNVR
jgi:hypothetical protein